MNDFFALYFRGLVYTILAIICGAVAFGMTTFAVANPGFAVPLLVLVILPIIFGIMTEGK